MATAHTAAPGVLPTSNQPHFPPATQPAHGLHTKPEYTNSAVHPHTDAFHPHTAAPVENRAMIHQFPGTGPWIKGIWVDILTMIALGAIALGVYYAKPAPTRSFPVTFANGEIVYPEYAYPLRNQIVPIWLAAFLAFIIPFLFFVIAQIRLRSFRHLEVATLGLLYALITAATFQVFLKWLIGGFRPHFLSVCNPDTSRIPGVGFGLLMFDRRICTGNEGQINDSLESFPSGHATAAFAGFVFLSLWFNSQLKIFSNYRPRYWKLILFYAPLLGATLIAGSLTIDKFHHATDVIAGGIIGTICAIGAYRMSYAALWDFRFNHVPLPGPGHLGLNPFKRAEGLNAEGGFDYGQSEVYRTATHKAQWGGHGHGGNVGLRQGAPNDAAYA